MVHTVEFCEARALEAASEARDAKLENVRERALRSEAAWRAMANRLQSVERNRDAARRAREARQLTE